MNNNNNGSSMLTLVTGAAIGAALGLLFAPETGSDTRKRIVKTAREYSGPIMEKVQKKVSDVYDYAEDYIPSSFRKEESDNSFLTSLAIALPIGAVLGILFAPAKGSETRSNLSSMISEGFGKITDSTGNLFAGAEPGNPVKTPGRGKYSM